MKRRKLTAALQEQVDRYRPMARSIAAHVWRAHLVRCRPGTEISGGMDLAELYGVAELALCESALRWDSRAGVTLGAYSDQRIRGACIDALKASWGGEGVPLPEGQAVVWQRPRASEAAEDGPGPSERVVAVLQTPEQLLALREVAELTTVWAQTGQDLRPARARAALRALVGEETDVTQAELATALAALRRELWDFRGRLGQVDWVSVPEAARRLGVARRTLQTWCEQDRVLCVRTRTAARSGRGFRVAVTRRPSRMSAGGST